MKLIFLVAENLVRRYGHAILTMELKELGIWNLGDIEWKDIIIEGDTVEKECPLK